MEAGNCIPKAPLPSEAKDGRVVIFWRRIAGGSAQATVADISEYLSWLQPAGPGKENLARSGGMKSWRYGYAGELGKVPAKVKEDLVPCFWKKSGRENHTQSFGLSTFGAKSLFMVLGQVIPTHAGRG